MPEITYSNGEADIVVNKDESTGAIIDIYTYVSDLGRINIPGNWSWKEGRNPVYTHLTEKSLAAFYSLLEDSNNGFYNLEN